jgi:predicted Zn-dependent protease
MRNIIGALVLGAALALAGADSAGAMGGGSSSPFASNPDQDYKDAVRAVNSKDYDKAIKLLTAVLKEKPNNADALNYMGYSHRKLGKHPDAVAYYRKALAVNPDHRGANEYLGEAHLEMNQLGEAEVRLAHLAKICNMNCDEYRELKMAVDAFKAGKKPPQSSMRTW